jgi:hypothetical protein
MNTHDWPAVRDSFADEFERIGPFPEHQFTDPDVYTQFLADLLPTIEGHTIELVRADTVGDTSYVTICERLQRDNIDVESYLVLACDPRARRPPRSNRSLHPAHCMSRR